MTEKKICVAVCYTTTTGPTSNLVNVNCSQEQYDNGEHYSLAKEFIIENEYGEHPMFTIDENDDTDLIEALLSLERSLN